MNKKNVILILVISCFLAVMAISVLGKNPEYTERIAVTGIVILDTEGNEITEVNNSKYQEKIISLPLSTDEVIYSFSVVVNPENATDTSLMYEILDQNFVDKVEIKELTYEEWKELKGIQDPEVVEGEEQPAVPRNIHYYTIRFISQVNLKLRFKTNKEDAVKTDYLMFEFTGSGHHSVVEID